MCAASRDRSEHLVDNAGAITRPSENPGAEPPERDPASALGDQEDPSDPDLRTGLEHERLQLPGAMVSQPVLGPKINDRPRAVCASQTCTPARHPLVIEL
jgi:hypothetical protein